MRSAKKASPSDRSAGLFAFWGRSDLCSLYVLIAREKTEVAMDDAFKIEWWDDAGKRRLKTEHFDTNLQGAISAFEMAVSVQPSAFIVMKHGTRLLRSSVLATKMEDAHRAQSMKELAEQEARETANRLVIRGQRRRRFK